jgi:hypothetical protein
MLMANSGSGIGMMNWDAAGAVGEIAGAIAVVLTLFYFSLQIRNMQSTSRAESTSRSAEGERELRKLKIEHAALILKADGFGSLTAEEELMLNEIYLSYQTHYFLAYLRSDTLDGKRGWRDVHARNFARELKKHPCLLERYQQGDLRGGDLATVASFAELVDGWLLVDGD